MCLPCVPFAMCPSTSHAGGRSIFRGLGVSAARCLEVGGSRHAVPHLQHLLVLPRVTGREADLLHFRLGKKAVGGGGVLGADAVCLDTALRRVPLRHLQVRWGGCLFQRGVGLVFPNLCSVWRVFAHILAGGRSGVVTIQACAQAARDGTIVRLLEVLAQQ